MIKLLTKIPKTFEIVDRVNFLLKTFQSTQKTSIKEVTTTYTSTLDDRTVLGDATAGAFSITLPKAYDSKGYIFTFIKSDVSANALTIDGDGSETINGATTKVLAAQYDTVDIQSDGTEYWII